MPSELHRSEQNYLLFRIVIAVNSTYLCPPSKKEGHIALHMSVGIPYLVQLITQERFALEAPNLVGR